MKPNDEIDSEVAAAFRVRRVVRSAVRQGFPKPTIDVRRAAFAAAVAEESYSTILSVLTGGEHPNWVNEAGPGSIAQVNRTEGTIV